MAVTVLVQARGLTREQRNAFVAAFLGWTMDAFDYFIVVLVYADIGKEFGVAALAALGEEARGVVFGGGRRTAAVASVP